ncbi:lipocalin-like domain-containing protein [Bradyrhizobium sp. BR 10289]|nr:lipocalin-like domain-containing protein [Bradyrhizobium sp. BR 10289]
MISLNELMGWWKLVRAWHEFPEAPTRWPFGTSATGSLVFTSDQRMMLAIIGAEQAALSCAIHSGRFALEGSEIITVSDTSSRHEWRHTELRYFVSLAHGALFLTSRQALSSWEGALYAGAPFVAAYTWVRQPEG